MEKSNGNGKATVSGIEVDFGGDTPLGREQHQAIAILAKLFGNRPIILRPVFPPESGMEPSMFNLTLNVRRPATTT